MTGPMNEQADVLKIFAYLIFVSYATHGVGVLFSSRCTFFHRERERDCFEQILFRPNINAILAIFVMKIIHPKKQMLHLM